MKEIMTVIVISIETLLTGVKKVDFYFILQEEMLFFSKISLAIFSNNVFVQYIYKFVMLSFTLICNQK